MNTMKAILATVGGIGAGLAIGLLTAPRSGKETRKTIQDDVMLRKENLEKAMNERLEEVKDLINSVANKTVENGKAVAEETK